MSCELIPLTMYPPHQKKSSGWPDLGLKNRSKFEKFSLQAGTPDYPASVQSGTEMNKNADAGTSPVPK